MNYFLHNLLISKIYEISPLFIQKSNILISLSSFNYISSYFFKYNYRFNSKFYKIKFNFFLNSIILKNSFYPSGNIYLSNSIPSSSTFEECGFLNFNNSNSNLIIYNNGAGIFMMERCTFYNISNLVWLTTTVMIEPSKYCYFKTKLFSKC